MEVRVDGRTGFLLLRNIGDGSLEESIPTKLLEGMHSIIIYITCACPCISSLNIILTH